MVGWLVKKALESFRQKSSNVYQNFKEILNQFPYQIHLKHLLKIHTFHQPTIQSNFSENYKLRHKKPAQKTKCYHGKDLWCIKIDFCLHLNLVSLFNLFVTCVDKIVFLHLHLLGLFFFFWFKLKFIGRRVFLCQNITRDCAQCLCRFFLCLKRKENPFDKSRFLFSVFTDNSVFSPNHLILK